MLSFFCYKAGKKTTDEELEEMLESGNPAIFTSGVSELGAETHAPPQRREAHGELHLGSRYRVEGGLQVWGSSQELGRRVREGCSAGVADGRSCVASRRSLTPRFPSKPSVRSRDGTRTS